MVENPESQYEGANAENFSASKNDLKPDAEEILRRKGPEFEPTPENNAVDQQSRGQGATQSLADPTSDPAGKTDDTKSAQELEKLKQDDAAYTKQRLAELRKELQQFQSNNEEPNQQNSSEVDQEEEHSQGIGQ